MLPLDIPVLCRTEAVLPLDIPVLCRAETVLSLDIPVLCRTEAVPPLGSHLGRRHQRGALFMA